MSPTEQVLTHGHKVLNLFGRPEVSHLDKASGVDEDVCALDVAVHDALLVQVVYAQQDLASVHPDHALLEAACMPHSTS